MSTDIRVDGRQLLQRALQELAPGEGIDEALLRACKALHPQQAAEVFGALGHLLDSLGRAQGDRSRFDTVTRLAAAKGPLTLALHTHATSVSHDVPLGGAVRVTTSRSSSVIATTLASGPLGDLPPEAQERLRALLGGHPDPPAPRGAEAAGSHAPAGACRHCGHPELGGLRRCPHCGRRQHVGLLRRLFGG
ncbi:MAG TPA: hypothetical protein PLE19_01290 [Planctomycetota bacterium]|nr:hypothetical protein [Planctomycetota bacterium]HRR78795.1 hypothetical protein [Planctomycetota bacterium]HRT94942.1 hypothetical protein [Planctomycetota bacterium]